MEWKVWNRPQGAGGRLLMSVAVAAAAMAAIAVAGCGSGNTVKQSAEEKLAKKDVRLYGLPAAKSVACDGGVDAKAGTDFNCHVTLANGQQVTLPSTVKSVNGDTARLRPRTDVIQQALAINVVYKSLAKANNVAKSVDCPAALRAKEGDTFDCHVTLTNGVKGTFTLRVDAATSNNQHLTVVRVRRTS